MRLDDAAVVMPPVDVVKLDLQGSEAAALRGMELLLRASPNVLVTTEFWPAGLLRAGADPVGLLEYLRMLGFAVGVQLPDEKGVLEMSNERLLAHCAARDGGEGHVNLVLERRPGT